jgi:hypothetical protein
MILQPSKKNEKQIKKTQKKEVEVVIYHPWIIKMPFSWIFLRWHDAPFVSPFSNIQTTIIVNVHKNHLKHPHVYLWIFPHNTTHASIKNLYKVFKNTIKVHYPYKSRHLSPSFFEIWQHDLNLPSKSYLIPISLSQLSIRC